MDSTWGTAAEPSLSFAQGQIAPGCSPNHSVVATGTTPSASRASCSVSPVTTTRSGAAGIVVVPYLWSIVTGNVSPAAVVAAGSSSEPHAASPARVRATVPAAAMRLRGRPPRAGLARKPPRAARSSGSR